MGSRRNERPLTLRPKGLSDGIDGTNVFPGAMFQLANLVPSATTPGLFVPRPAATLETDFTGSGITTPAGTTALLVIGQKAYGMISSASFSGKDEPFIYDLATDTFITISGLAAGLLPATQLTTGDWQPPHMEMIGNRILVTHPGFSAGSGVYFGWIDMTGFSLGTLKGNTSSGSPIISSITGDGSSNPILDGIQPGQTISGTNIPAGAYIKSVANGTTDINTAGDTHTNTTIDGIASTTGMAAGMYVTGSGIPAGAYITSVDSGTQITISAAATATASAVAINVSGGGSITISANATGTANLTTLTIAGGTAASPLWGAGNTNVNGLVTVPKWVSNFNNRAWFAVNNMEVYSDSLNPLNITNASQALTLGDDQDVTASVWLPLNNISTGGIIQALIAIKGDAIMFQITGDAATSNLSANTLNVSVGTLAPNTICSTPLGVAFVAPDGLRMIDFQAHVTDPIGANGSGVCVPFISAIDPTRMCAAFNQNVLRVSVKNGNLGTPVWQEYWLDFNLKIWTGPHSFPAQQIQPYQYATGAEGGHGFLLAGQGIDHKLWLSGVNPVATDSYVENGTQLNWTYQPALFPDNTQMSMNRMGQSAIAMAVPVGLNVGFTVSNEIGTLLDQTSITGTGVSPSMWGSMTLGTDLWGSSSGYYRQYNIPWHVPLIFKQANLIAAGQSVAGTIIGNLYLKYQPLGYLLDIFVTPPTPSPAANDIVTEAGDNLVTNGGDQLVTEGTQG